MRQPTTETAIEPDPGLSGEVSGSGDRTVRVVHLDDDPSFLTVARELLERQSDRLDVRTTTDPSDVLDLMDAGAVDCVVSDYQMPRTSGLDVLERVRDAHPDFPFVLFTGQGNEEVASEAISAGVSDYVQKGSRTDRYSILANRIETVVDEYRVRKHANRAYDAIEAAREGISLLDDDGQFIYVNAAYREITGYEPDELIGEHWETLYPEDDGDHVRETILPAVATEGSWSGETVYVRRDGSTIVVDHAITYTNDGTLVCLVRVRDEADGGVLIDGGCLADALFRTVDDPAFVVSDDGAIQRANEAATNATGFDKRELVAMGIDELLAGRDRERTASLLQGVLDEGASRFDATMRGPEEPVSVTAEAKTIPDQFGNAAGILLVGREASRA